MAKSTDRLVRSVEQLKEGAMYLKLADQLVKDGHYERALAEIAKARTANPNNLYALAYEERVRSLLTSKQRAAQKAGAQRSQTIPPEGRPSLEQISTLASVEAQRTLESELKRARDLEAQRNEEETRRSLEEQRRNALQAKMKSIITRIIDYQARGDFDRALSEVERAYVLDPDNEQVRVLEEQILLARQESAKRGEEARIRQLKMEEQAREELLREENKRIERERAEARERIEEARRNAQREKIQEYIGRTKEHLAAGRLDDALTELAFVVVIDPLNEEVLQFEHQIRDMVEQRRQLEQEEARRREQEQSKKLDAIRVTIQKHIHNADQLCAEGNFNEALRIITRAYIVDPLNPDLQECETRILTAQEQASEVAAQERRVAEEAERIQREEQRRAAEAAERERLMKAQEAELEAKNRADKEQILHHLARAKEHLTEGQFENALGEVALAFIVDPFDDHIKLMEQEILRAKENQGNDSPPEEVSLELSEASEKLAVHLAAIERYRDAGEYEKALEEIARACIIDPLHPKLQEFETEIQEAYRNRRQPANQEEPPKQKKEGSRKKSASSQKRDEGTRQHLWSAMEYLERREFDDAEREIQAGLELKPDAEELLALKVQLEKQRTEPDEPVPEEMASPEPEPLPPADNRTLERHIRTATDLIRAEAFDEAIAEVALGLTIDPRNTLLRELEEQIWAAQNSADHGNGEMVEPADPPAAQTETPEVAIRVHILVAGELYKEGRYNEALDEIAKAYAIDPLNKEIRKMEIQIRQYELRGDQQDEPQLKLIYPNQHSAGAT